MFDSTNQTQCHIDRDTYYKHLNSSTYNQSSNYLNGLTALEPMHFNYNSNEVLDNRYDNE